MFTLTQKKKGQLQEELAFQYSRSSGPGGQKVNKTETQVELRWSVTKTSVFHSEQIEMIQIKLENKINKEGELILKTDKFRGRLANQKFCLELFYRLLGQALTVPKKRRASKPKRSAIEKRIQEKKHHSEKKKNRQKYES